MTLNAKKRSNERKPEHSESHAHVKPNHLPSYKPLAYQSNYSVIIKVVLLYIQYTT
jgi:hypothetical protein